MGERSYARCVGQGNADYTFEQLNGVGGSVRTTVNYEPEEFCKGESFNMEAFVAGGVENDRRTELWVEPPSGGGEVHIYNSGDPFDIEFENITLHKI